MGSVKCTTEDNFTIKNIKVIKNAVALAAGRRDENPPERRSYYRFASSFSFSAAR